MCSSRQRESRRLRRRRHIDVAAAAAVWGLLRESLLRVRARDLRAASLLFLARLLEGNLDLLV